MPRKGKRHAHLSRVAEKNLDESRDSRQDVAEKKETKAVLALTSMSPEAANSRTSEVPPTVFLPQLSRLPRMSMAASAMLPCAPWLRNKLQGYSPGKSKAKQHWW